MVEGRVIGYRTTSYICFCCAMGRGWTFDKARIFFISVRGGDNGLSSFFLFPRGRNRSSQHSERALLYIYIEACSLAPRVSSTTVYAPDATLS